MPMPTLLPDIEWQSIFGAAWDYETWRKDGMARVDNEFLGTYPEDKHEKLRAFLADNEEERAIETREVELTGAIERLRELRTRVGGGVAR